MKHHLLLSLVLCAFDYLCKAETVDEISYMNDLRSSIQEIIEREGFEFERHIVGTKDGFQLVVHRIKTEGAKPILMQHGIDAGSSEWISNSAEESPAFKMARAGYDVWLGNNRGNYLSKKNIYRGHETAEYWNFDQEEMGLIDLPAMIDHILEVTGKQKLASYIAHSQGTTQFLMGSSLMPDYFDSKVGIGILLAPVVRLDLAPDFTREVASSFFTFLYWLEQILGLWSFENRRKENVFLAELCEIDIGYCGWVGNVGGFYNSKLNSLHRMPTYLAKSRLMSGWRCYDHLRQIYLSKRFQRYDFGHVKNRIYYGTLTPPLYDLRKIRNKIGLFWGEEDFTYTPEASKWLNDPEQSGLSTIVYSNVFVNVDHYSFSMAKKTYFMDTVIELTRKYSQ